MANSRFGALLFTLLLANGVSLRWRDPRWSEPRLSDYLRPETLSAVRQSVNGTKLLVVTVPELARSRSRLSHLAADLDEMGLPHLEEVHGPNMEHYCPSNISNYNESKAAGIELLRSEWHGQQPNMSQYDLALFQSAILVAHLRVWHRVVELGTDAIVLEDDAAIDARETLEAAIYWSKLQGAHLALLEKRHCMRARMTGHAPDSQASGTTGYWIDPVGAKLLLEQYSVDRPVDWLLNKLYSAAKGVCAPFFPVRETGGTASARKETSAKGCGRRVAL